MNTLIPIDYHVHSNNSPDCRASMADQCRAALQKGIAEIAFTEHFNAKPEDGFYGKYNADRYFKDFETCRDEFARKGLTVKAGCEVGEYHLYRDEVDTVIASRPYDVILGSLHWNKNESVFERSYFNNRTMRTIAEMYYAEMLEMVEAGGFNVLSHMDVYKRMGYQVYNHFDIREFEEFVRPVLEACVRQGIAPEINTTGLRLSVCQTHPTVDAIRWYREVGGELLTVGSDSHRTDHTGYALDQAMAIAKAAGFTRLTKFKDRKVEDFVEI